MTTLNTDTMMVSADMADAFGSFAPVDAAGLVKELGQTGIFIFSKSDYILYLKNAAGNWVLYGNITGARETLTVPWGDNTAAYFRCANNDATIHVHRKQGNILYDTTPENSGDDQNTLLTSAGSAAQAAKNYTFPEADGTDGQVLKTDGAGALSWSSSDMEFNGLTILKAALADGVNFTWSGSGVANKIAFARVLTSNFDGTPFDTATYEFTVPSDGYYEINANLSLNNIMTDPSQYQTIIGSDTSTSETWSAGAGHALEGIYILAMTQFDPPSSQSIHRMDVTSTAYLTAGTKISLYMRQMGGTFTSNLMNVPMQTNLIIKKL